jgi:bifunctional non-homologous end joining protein LigD
MAKKIKAGNRIIDISNEDKILFPKAKYTKLDIINYYSKISTKIIPFLKDRPLTLRRFPNGIDETNFYQKNTPEYYPDWIERIPVEKSDKTVIEYLNCKNTATLIYIANQAGIELHPWLSKLPNLNNPDKIIFDLDPSTLNFNLVKETALLLKNILTERGFTPYIMTTGSKGLHIIAPLKPLVNFDRVRDFAKNLAEELVSQDPKNLTTEIRIEKRGKKLFLDYLRNSWSATAICPYGVRAKEDAPVATPIFWDEVKDKSLISQRYNIKSVLKKLKDDGDPWKTMNRHRTKLK